jgi:hypothetical protein
VMRSAAAHLSQQSVECHLASGAMVSSAIVSSAIVSRAVLVVKCHLCWKPTRWHRLRPAGSPEAAFSARSSPDRPPASVSLGQTAGRL